MCTMTALPSRTIKGLAGPETRFLGGPAVRVRLRDANPCSGEYERAVPLCSRIAGCKALRFAVDTASRVAVYLYRRFYGSLFNRQSISTVGRVAVHKAERGEDLRPQSRGAGRADSNLLHGFALSMDRREYLERERKGEGRKCVTILQLGEDSPLV